MSNDLKRPSRIKRIWEFLKRAFRRLEVWLLRFNPSRRTRRGAVIAAFAAVILLMGYCGAVGLRTGLLVDVLLGAAMGGLLLAISTGLIAALLALFARLPKMFMGALLGALLSLLPILEVFQSASILVAAVVVLVASLLGGAIAVLTGSDFKIARTAKRVMVIVALVAAVGISAWFFVWLASPGTDEGLVKVEQPLYRPVSRLAEADPSTPGPFKVRTLTYGSGEDRREEFGAKAQLRTPRVDGKPFLTKLDGWFAPIRNGYWGFDRRKLPLNGRVWYPEGEGKFPLVLIVHGNHLMREYSDPGYAYLGDLLASRGCIFVSVDENFLNGDWSDNYKKENDARGWVLLEHLRVWRDWNSEAGNPFYQKIDLDRIALIGHSRGGEAVAVAAAFNRLSRYPDDARVKFDYGFNIRSVVAIAPVDGQYMPASQSTPLENINYLLLQGAHDADLSFFSGDRQYKRIKFTDGRYWFKTSLYIYRANHGQFNTVWANRDWGLPFGYVLNVEPLLTGEEQREIAKVYISAFLDVTLKSNDAYLPLFRDHRVAAQWLPKTFYVNRFEDSRTHIVCDYDEDIDVTTATMKGGVLSGERLRTWKEKDIGFRGSDTKRQNQAAYLGWNYTEQDSTLETVDSLGVRAGRYRLSKPASYVVDLPRDLGRTWRLDGASTFVFSLAQSEEKPADTLDIPYQEEADASKDLKEEEKASKEKKAEEDTLKKPIDFTIEAQDRLGQRAVVLLSRVARLLPPLDAKFTKSPLTEQRFSSPSEPVLQTIEVPMARFVEANRRFNPAQIASVRFVFDRSPSGVIILDELGFRSSE